MATLKDLSARQLKIERKFQEISEASKKGKLSHDQLLEAMQKWEEFIKSQAKIVHNLAIFSNLIMEKLDISPDEISKAHETFNSKRETLKDDYSNQDTKNPK